MSAITPEKLYGLLPAIHRLRDAAQDAPLQALLTLAAEQGAVVEADIERLLDNWFIETCDDWVVPYLGDLLGVRGLHALTAGVGFSQRTRVANTLAYRRRKGTATMLEQLARDTTGWPARAVEFFEVLGWNQHLNHIRLHAPRTPDLRRTDELELLNTAFDRTTRTVDVRRIALDRGRHNVPNVGLFLWRLQAYFISGGTARPLGGGFYTFSPVAEETPRKFARPLFNRPQTETDVTHVADEINVPGPLRRRPLFDELETRRGASATGLAPTGSWFARGQPVLRVFQQRSAFAAFVEVPAEKIRICHLGEGASRPDPTLSAGQPTIIVGVDPMLGRLAWADTLALPTRVKVSYAYGFSGDLGGGPYDRTESVTAARALAPASTWHVGVATEITSVGGETIHPTLADAIADWNAQPAGTIGFITVMDSHSYVGDLAITIPEGSSLFIIAADWPALPRTGGGHERRPGQFYAAEVRPHLQGDIRVTTSAPMSGQTPGVVAFDGLWIEGRVTVNDPDHRLGRLRLAHCTLVPSAGGLRVSGLHADLHVELVRTICGPITVTARGAGLALTDCIVDAGTGSAMSAAANAVDVQSSTVFGRVNVRRLDAGNSLFTGVVNATRQQEGCVRFCYVAPDSTTGRRYRCQPELAQETVAQLAAEAGKPFGTSAANAVVARVTPIFTSREYGHPAYAQLATSCPPELRTGAEDGAEIGAFRFLQQPQREANLRASLDEYLRLGLEAGLIFAT